MAPASEAVTEALALPFLVVPDAVAREGNRLSPTAFGKLPLNNIELEDFDAPDNGAATGAVHLSSPSSTSAAPGTEETKVLNRHEMCSCAFDRLTTGEVASSGIGGATVSSSSGAKIPHRFKTARRIKSCSLSWLAFLIRRCLLRAALRAATLLAFCIFRNNAANLFASSISVSMSILGFLFVGTRPDSEGAGPSPVRSCLVLLAPESVPASSATTSSAAAAAAAQESPWSTAIGSTSCTKQ